MLWTTIATLSWVLLLALLIKNVLHGQEKRAIRLAGLMIGWSLNLVAGGAVFYLTGEGHITNYWVWKPLLMASSFVFMALVALCLYVERFISKVEPSPLPVAAVAMVAAAGAFSAGLGGIFLFAVWTS